MIKEISHYGLSDVKVREFFLEALRELGNFHGRDFDISLYGYLDGGGRIAVYENKQGEIMGCSMVRIIEHFWTGKTVVYQDLLYGQTPRASYELFNDMIDFTKNNAEAIITMRNEFTKINELNLLKRGFKKLEESYFLEV